MFFNKFMSMFIEWAKDDQKEGGPITLSKEVKKPGFDCLKTIDGSKLESGDASLRRHIESSQLTWACRLEMQTEVIMVWDIATTMCESQVSKLDLSNCRKNFWVATNLSKCLAYLIAFAPRLLFDHSYITEFLLNETLIEARHLLKGCKRVQERINKLRASLGMIEHSIGV